ncbi:uncharacterized protein LY79DRAFT_656859 [Colletotrichum navitas]|uniref:Uncharacterized protein n=1 Tax=Colletotrichum navitas TaxID=681940 RepID=A0AAD8Q6F1_9PEZI|nr:uncharacterized protein LY79DRAFT_656859 [Colletotrichum navitas]KAK1596783.1 hypothetical protein LY79DRAFT_656859 [Colletotrichum navitas]
MGIIAHVDAGTASLSRSSRSQCSAHEPVGPDPSKLSWMSEVRDGRGCALSRSLSKCPRHEIVNQRPLVGLEQVGPLWVRGFQGSGAYCLGYSSSISVRNAVVGRMHSYTAITDMHPLTVESQSTIATNVSVQEAHLPPLLIAPCSESGRVHLKVSTLGFRSV